MSSKLTSINKFISVVCLFIYVLFGAANTNAMSICYGSAHSKHIGINICGYEPCCSKEKSVQHKTVSNPQSTPSSYQSTCNCNDQKIISDNTVQQITTKYKNISLDTSNNSIESIPLFTISFDEKFNKTNWNIYNRRKIDNNLITLNTIILII